MQADSYFVNLICHSVSRYFKFHKHLLYFQHLEEIETGTSDGRRIKGEIGHGITEMAQMTAGRYITRVRLGSVSF